MENLSFNSIHTLGHIVFENTHFKHYHDPEMLLGFNCNFIAFKQFPTLSKFKEAETYLRRFHLKNGQKHLKFYFPENEKLDKTLMDYFSVSGYKAGYNEMYAIQPNQFPKVSDNSDIEIQAVTDENFEVFLKLQYETDLQFGKAFARQKINMYKQNFSNKAIQQIMAIFKGTPAGSVDVIIAENTAEIDSLAVKESFQKNGIASRLQKFVMDTFFDKTIILVTDGEDTPRIMYQKQNYQYLGFKYEIQKIYE